MPTVYAPVLVLICIVALLGLGVWIFKSGAMDGLYSWINKEVWAIAPPSWPRPVPPTADNAPPTSEDSPAASPVPDPTGSPAASGGGGRPRCPDGSGTCESDDTPRVPPVGYPPGCGKDDISVETFNRRQTWNRWTTAVPIFGPMINGISLAMDGGATHDPSQQANDALQNANFSLQQANAIWQDAYVNYLTQIGPTVLRVTKDVFGADGMISVTAEAAALPLVQAAHLLVAPMLGLLVCSLILVWAV